MRLLYRKAGPIGTLVGVYRPTHAPRLTGEAFDANIIILDEVGVESLDEVGVESLNEMVGRKPSIKVRSRVDERSARADNVNGSLGHLGCRAW